ncbi:hypothetical protein [Hymenobacter algoricola]|uniref:Uncharacterized protein n=1 Tax=Hymenobacter algoricola TaxID=486267 RepID=A0ABP7NWZ4_9BACT
MCRQLNLRSNPPELTAAMRYILRAQLAALRRPQLRRPQAAHGLEPWAMTTGFCLEALTRYRALTTAAAVPA